MFCDMPPDFFSETKQKARKEHICCECGKKILKGETYWRSNGKWDGELSTFPQHPWCRAACTHLSKLDPYGEGCIPFTGMFEAFSDHNGDKGTPLRKYMARVKREMRKPERAR